jgi:hypothetical protein
MEKLFLSALAVAAITAAITTSCSNDDSSKPSVSVTFRLDGDWQGSDEAFTTRAAVSGSTMNDVWVLDYMGGTLQQTVHQSNGDDSFGAPTLSLSYGSHTLYFVTSAGESPTLNTNAHTLSFGSVRDTFWKTINVNVTSGTAANQDVTLDRIVTKVAIQPTDEVPASISTITIAPATWYLTFDYLTGNPTEAVNNFSRTLTIPDSYKGTTGTLKVNLLGLCGADYTTNVAVTAKDADNNTIGYAAISNASMKRNRASRYTGTLFGNSNGLTMNIDDTWLTDYEGTW